MFNPDQLTSLLNDTLSHQVTQFGLAFTFAAWVHSKQVRKEIKKQFGDLINVIRADLQLQNKRMDELTSRVDKLENNKG